MSFKSSGMKTRPERMKPVPTPDSTHAHSYPRSRRSSASSTGSTASFHSAFDDTAPTSSHLRPLYTPSQNAQNASLAARDEQEKDIPRLRFSPSQEALHIAASNALKASANTQFSRGDYSSALGTYDKAIAELPTYLDYELAVLQSNIAACHLRLEEWRDAVRAAERGWECLENLDPTSPPATTGDKDSDDKDSNKQQTKKGTKREGGGGKKDEETSVIELPESNDDAANAELLRTLEISDARRQDIIRIRTKLLLRRARARYVLGSSTGTNSSSSSSPNKRQTKDKDKNPFAQAAGLAGNNSGGNGGDSDPGVTSAWSNLSAALTDYQTLLQPKYFNTLPASDQKTVRGAAAVLPGLAEQAKEREVAEMMGKLKELGNGILKPFGLSTDMFKMEKDPASGGMSLKFDGGKK